MLILSAAQNTQLDHVALAMVLALAVIVAVMAIRKRFSTKKKAPEKPAAPGSAGQIKLHGVAPKTAADSLTGANRLH